MCVCACAHACMCVHATEYMWRSQGNFPQVSPFHHASLGEWSSGCQAWWSVSLPCVPSHHRPSWLTVEGGTVHHQRENIIGPWGCSLVTWWLQSQSRERSVGTSFSLYFLFRAPAQGTVPHMFRVCYLTLINLSLKSHADVLDICFHSKSKSHQWTARINYHTAY